MSLVKRIIILADDAAHSPEFEVEHGLSMALVLDDSSFWLWDVGQNGAFQTNSRKLGLDFTAMRGLALSHGHYDHTSGLPGLLSPRSGPPLYAGKIYAHQDAARERFAIKGNTPVRSIGLDKSRIPFPLPGFVPVRDTAELCPGITLITDIPRLEGNFQAVKYFFLDREGLTPDMILDDACLGVETAKGMVMVLGCCHSGLANTLERAAQVLGVKEFHAVLGGLHLIGAGTGPIQESARALEKFQVQRIFAGHCTGESEAGQLANLLPGRVFPLGAGLVVDF